jgi:hypothetical protein
MDKTLLVSLVSDQTIPNVLLIEEFKDQVDDFLFLTTNAMEKKGCRKWIEDTTKIKSLNPIVVNQFSVDDIVSKLNDFDFSAYSKIIVNLTGGTKIMTLSAHDYFKEEGANIYYVTGAENNYLKIFPGKKKIQCTFKSKISVNDYLMAYGFEVIPTSASEIPFEYTKTLFSKYCQGEFDNELETLTFLRKKRTVGVKTNDFGKIKDFLKKIEFTPSQDNCLTSLEVKYLSGEWFEEYVGTKLKMELNLPDEDILIGAEINKSVPQAKEENPVIKLLGDIELSKAPNNEIDVMFMWKGKFHVIECKTSLIDTRKELKIRRNSRGMAILDQDGKEIQDAVNKQVNILGETIYKSDTLKTKFGLFANSYIFTLTDFKEYIKNDLSRTRQMEGHINRASLSRIKIVDKEQILSNNNLMDLL